jgi:hypothetical protein
MKRLPMEITVMVESRPCRGCKGSGDYLGRPCVTCAGYGRLATAAGRELLRETCALINAAAPLDSSNRFDTTLMTVIVGKDLAPGMTVKPVRGFEPNRFRVVASVERVGLGTRVQFEDGSAVAASDTEHFTRELSPFELSRCDVWLAQHIRKGAVEIAA